MKRIAIDLDPAHPSLDHHRPGEFPLFGTAMAISAMVDATKVAGGICDVVIHRPYLLTTPGVHRLFVEFGGDGGAVRVVSNEGVHFEGRIEEAAKIDTSAVVDSDVDWDGAVAAAEIYRSFFHGPAFQLVAAARFTGATLISRLSSQQSVAALPELVRLIEFGLHSAGLLELALSGRMMIPHHIARVAVDGPLREAEAVFAEARQRPDGVCDIIVSSDRPILSIKGYATVDLPFPADGAKLGSLRQSLIATSKVFS